MILLDFSGALYASIAVDLKQNCGTKTDIGYLRYLVLNMIRSYNKKFRKKYGELVICMDSKVPTWRSDVFPYYKMARKKMRIDSGIDWESVWKDINIITEEIDKYLPFRMIKVDTLEADDIIAILSMEAEQICEKDILGDLKNNILIISNDKDYGQLHSLSYVSQFKPRSGNIVKERHPDFMLTDLILHGDRSDGIPNIFSDEDTFIEIGKRQHPVTTKFMQKFLTEGISCLNENELNRYNMNKKLISFQEIPSKYKQIVIDAYKNSEKDKRNQFKMLQYFASNNMRKFVDFIEDFK